MNMDWIHVSDRLPPVGLNVLAHSRFSESYFVAYVAPGGKWWYLSFGNTPLHNITHWMPLPDQPQDGEAA